MFNLALKKYLPLIYVFHGIYVFFRRELWRIWLVCTCGGTEEDERVLRGHIQVEVPMEDAKCPCGGGFEGNLGTQDYMGINSYFNT